MKKYSLFYLIALLLLLSSCSDEVFKASRKKNKTKANELVNRTTTYENDGFSLIRPKVDLLFLWDNSTSTNFINPQTKAALNRVINHISNRFDYHVLMAPLVANNNEGAVFFSRNPLSPGSGIKVVTREMAANEISLFQSAKGSYEAGAQRARDIIRNNISNKVFRKKAYTIIVLMSNDDDKSYVTGNYDILSVQKKYIDNRAYDLNCIRGNFNQIRPSDYTGPFGTNCSGTIALDSPMMRLFSIVAINPSLCASSGVSRYTINSVYKSLSKRIYQTPYTNGISSPNDDISSLFDSYDMCLENYSFIFDGINNAITDTVLSHRYNFWPVAGLQDSVDPNTLSVLKDNGEVILEISPSNPLNGYSYVGNKTNQNTRYAPTPGEPFTAKMIELFGDAKVNWPGYITINSSAEREYLGYCHMPSEPDEGTIIVQINGKTIPRGGTNGWSLVTNSNGSAFHENNKNIRIKSPTDFSPATPSLVKSGFFVKLSGSSVYSNSTSCSVEYLPAAK